MERLHHVKLFVCHRQLFHLLTSEDVSVVLVTPKVALTADHDEADTRIFLHAKHAADAGFASVITSSTDTDVAVIGIHHANVINASLLWLTGTRLRRRCVSLTNIAVNLGEDMSAALPGIHAFSGWDTTSAFCGKGKATAFRLASQKDCLRLAMTNFGCSLAPSEELFVECERFVCHLYGLPTCTSVNEARYELFRMKCPEAQQMLPTQDALRQHVLRSNYQCFAWKNALRPLQNLPSPHRHGWVVEADKNVSQIHVCWMTQPPAPKALMELVSCKCTVGCATHITVQAFMLLCTDACAEEIARIPASRLPLIIQPFPKQNLRKRVIQMNQTVSLMITKMTVVTQIMMLKITRDLYICTLIR